MKLLVIPLFLLFLLPLNSEAKPSNFYEAVICDDCSYVEAKKIAQRLKYQPQMQCRNDVGNNFEDIVYEQCWSTPIKLVIHDVQQDKTYAFKVGHNNQGQPRYDLTPYVQDLNTVPNEIRTLLTNTTNGYKVLTNVTRHLNRNFKIDAYTSSSNSFQTFNYAIDENSIGILSNCANSPEMKAMNLAHNLTAMANIQVEANDKVVIDENFKGSFQDVRIIGANFQGALGSFGIGGTVEYVDITKNVITDFTYKSEYFGQGKKNQVVFDLKLIDGWVEVSTNERGTSIGGYPLRILRSSGGKNGTLNSNQFSECLAEAIDKAFPKTVSDSNGNHLSTLDGSGYKGPSLNHFPLSGRNNGNGGGAFCTHTYYDLNGEELFSFEGACP